MEAGGPLDKMVAVRVTRSGRLRRVWNSMDWMCGMKEETELTTAEVWAWALGAGTEMRKLRGHHSVH